VQSLISPLEIKVSNPVACTSCQTKDCIRGRDEIPGCELQLFQPRKSSNMDCTFCLDCIHSCPHDNIGILASSPGKEIWRDAHRSGIGRFGRRFDLAALCVVLVFGAFASAAFMTGPLLDGQARIATALGFESPLLATTALYLVSLIGLPLLIVGGAAIVSRAWGRLTPSASAVATMYSYSLVPLGFAMWLAHYSFHFFTSYLAVVPTTQRFLTDRGWTVLGAPDWSCGCCAPVAGWLLRMQIVFLDLGLLLSLYAGYRIALSQSQRLPQALKTFAPWAMLILMLFGIGIWILFQPMQMRGAM
jgi:hypothetical protein